MGSKGLFLAVGVGMFVTHIFLINILTPSNTERNYSHDEDEELFTYVLDRIILVSPYVSQHSILHVAIHSRIALVNITPSPLFVR
jgi:hypothetical protein